jgi:enoyl-CoA hydratase
VFASDNRDQRQALARAITQMVAQLLAIPVPVVGAINSQALGREFVLTLACDDYGGHRGCEARDDRRTGRRPLCGGPLEIMRHELYPELLRRLTLTRAVLSMRQRLESRIIDELCAVDDLKSRSLVQAKNLVAQPALRTVKRQIRGGLAQRVGALAFAGQDPFVGDFG